LETLRCGIALASAGGAQKKLIAALKSVAEAGPSESCVLSIIQSQALAAQPLRGLWLFEAASLGYPTLVARSGLTEPDVLELSRFLYAPILKLPGRARPEPLSTSEAEDEGKAFEVLVVVFDVITGKEGIRAS